MTENKTCQVKRLPAEIECGAPATYKDRYGQYWCEGHVKEIEFVRDRWGVRHEAIGYLFFKLP